MRYTTVGSMFRESAARFPQRSCVETPEACASYAEVDRITDRIASSLFHRGIGKGSRAGIWCKDSPAFLYLYLALEKLGAVPVLLNTSLGAKELRAMLSVTEVSLLFYDDGFKGVSFPQLVKTMGLKNALYIPDFLESLASAGSMLPREELDALYAAVTPEDPDVIIFTSGTSGAAKGVLTNHYARVNVAQAQVDTIAMTEQDKLCVAIPMFHCFGLTGIILAALCCGACLYFPPERRTKRLLESVSVHRCTVFSAVPTLFSALLGRRDLADYDLSSLRTGYIGGAVYTPEFFHRVEKALGISLAPSLGQTEATAGLTFISPDAPIHQRESSVGRFLEGLEGQIRDIGSGKSLPLGQTGEICIRGFSVMLEYVNQPELTRQALEEDGWLHTGDLGWLDEDGCLHLAGRLKELIIRGGENISPGEIEATLLADPRIREVKAVAVPDDHYGEEICACVVPAPGTEAISPEEIRELVAGQLAAYKVPRYVLLLSALPKTGSGKLALATLKDQAREALGL